MNRGLRYSCLFALIFLLAAEMTACQSPADSGQSGTDSGASGTDSEASGTCSEASGTDSKASGTDSEASGTGSGASGAPSDGMPDTLLLTGENKYTIVFDKDTMGQVRTACSRLKEYLGGGISVSTDERAEIGENEILVGLTNRPESAAVSQGLGDQDYRIAVEGKKLVIAGGCDAALIHGVLRLMEEDGLVLSEDGNWQIAANYEYFFDGPDNRDEYIANPERFLPNWVLLFETPEWLLDFEEKMAAFRDPAGRMMTTHHRGGMVYYPENSIESIISSVLLGADTIEIDCMKSLDGVVVLMHDTTLGRMTDWSLKAGKNGLPSSENVSDWTYEQLCELRLLSGGEVSDYRIPTLEEALIVCKNRTTLRLDKWDCWDWDEDIWPLIQKTEAWRTIIIPEHLGLEKQTQVMDDIKARSGYDSLFYYDVYTNNCAEWLSIADTFPQNGSVPVVRWYDFRARALEATLEKVSPYLEQLTERVRIYVTVQQSDTANGQNPERPELWDSMYSINARMMLIDQVVTVQMYIAQNYEPTPY